MTEVFDDYIVKYTANTAATTQSNTSDWEYVGVDAAAPSTISGKQTIKYWDYSTIQYDFAAYSTSDIASDKIVTDAADYESGKLLVSPITKASASVAPTYSFTGAANELAKVYISDLVTAYKATMSPAQPGYQQEVTLTFRNLTSKARVALYETIPGYSVTDVKFYTNNTTTEATGASATSATLFAPGTAASDVFYTSGKATVTFPTRGGGNISASDYNKAHVAITESTSSETLEFGALNYTSAEDRELSSLGTGFLGRKSTEATFAAANSDPYYITVMPNEAGTVLELRIDYTLVPTDGANETIKIHGATAYVPAHFAVWNSNYAYTYLFKITDNTNGWTSTSTDDPKGLFPITFDAVVVETKDHEQTTITTVAIPTITTYQVGHVYNATDTYAAGDIYIQAMDNSNTPATLMNLKADNKSKLYVVTGTNLDKATEADILDALNIRSSTGDGGSPIVGFNGFTLTETSGDAALEVTGFTTIPGVDGNNITIADGNAGKFTAASGTVYAFVYEVSDAADTRVCIAETLTAEPTDWSTAGVWFTNEAGTTAVGATFTPGVYYKYRYTNNNTTYGVKVIKVQ